MKKCAVVYNPNSGKNKKQSDFVKNVESILKEYHYDVDFFGTTKPGDATEIVSQLEDIYHLVIIAGGDGTLNEGISGNLKRKHQLVLGALPVGTTNDVGTMYGYTKNYKKDLELLLNGVVKTIDTCFINKKTFIYVACLGNYVDISYETPRRLKEKYGRLGYVLYGITKLPGRMKQYPIEYEVEGEKGEGKFSFIFITNSSRVAGVSNIYEDVKLNDQKFEVAFCEAKHKADLIRMLPSLFTMNVTELPEIKYYRTNHLKIHFKEPFLDSWCLDGEEYHSAEDTFEFRVVNKVKMLVPKKNVKKLFHEEKKI